MIDDQRHPFEKWEDDLFDSIKSFSPSEEMLNKFQKYISDILTKSKLQPPIDEFTYLFIEEFCPKLILFILSSHPPVDKAPIINSFLSTLIPLYSKRLINNVEDGDFLKTSKMIIFDSKTQFYKFTSKSGSEKSEFYQNNIQTFVESGVIENATEFLNVNNDVEISKILLFISNFYPFRNLFKKNSLMSFYSTALLKLQKKIHSLRDNEIRSVNEKEVMQASIYIHQILSHDASYSENLENLNFEMYILAIRFAKSPYLSKQYVGLSFIRMQLINSVAPNEKTDVIKKKKRKKNSNNNSNSSVITDEYTDNDNDNKEADEKEKIQHKLCNVLDDEQVIPNMLHNLHYSLVSEFLIVFKIMLQYNLITSDDLQELWSLTIKQHQTTIDIFIKAIEDLMNFLNEKLTKKLWKIFARSEKFPTQVLLFFQRIANKGTDSKRIFLYNSLIVYYKKVELESTERSVLIDTMCVLLPENTSTCEELQQQCFETMEEESEPDYDFSLALLKASCKSMKPTTAHECFHKLLEIIKKVPDETTLKFLAPMKQMVVHFKDPFTDEEFEELIRITTLLVVSHQDEVISFYSTIFEIQNKKSEIQMKEVTSSVQLLNDDSNDDYSEEDDEEEEDNDDSNNEKSKKMKQKSKNKERKKKIKDEPNPNNNYILDHDKIILLLQKMCEVDPPPIDFIIFLFEEINKKNLKSSSTFASPMASNRSVINNSTNFDKVTKSAESLSGIDLLWSINFKYDNIMQITNYLCNLYSKSQNSNDIKDYMKRCLKHMETESTFITIRLMMDTLEWKFDKLSRNIEENKYYTKLDCYEIHIIGYSSKAVRIPKLYHFDAFCERIAYLLDLKRNDISIYIVQDNHSNENQEQKVEKIGNVNFYMFDDNNDSDNNDVHNIPIKDKDIILLTHYNFSSLFKDDMIIGVCSSSMNATKSLMNNYRVSFSKEYSDNHFPSLYLSKANHFSVIFEFVKHNNNNKFARIALDIVNRLPPSEKELEIIRSEAERKPNWKRIFSLKNNHWCIFLYRLNIIGCLLDKESEWIDSFYMSGGSLWLSNILFTNAISYFTSNEDLQLILEVATLLLQKIENKNLKKKMITSLGTEAAEKIVTLALNHKDSLSLLQTLSKLIYEFADVLPNVFIYIKSFTQLFNFAIFHKNQKIREFITKTVNFISPLKFLKPIVRQLPRANNPYCDEYFTILNDIAHAYSTNMMQMMADTLYSKYKMNEKAKLIDQLSFIPPNEKFTCGFFKVFDQVVSNNKIASSSKDQVFTFIVNNILFNKLKYYNPNQNLFNILSYFLENDPELADVIIQKTFIGNQNDKINDDSQLIPINHFSFNKHRGIKNLGATCYMNATIQALYNIHRFRYLILKKYTVNEISKMKQIYNKENEGKNNRISSNSILNFIRENDDYYDISESDKDEEEEDNYDDDDEKSENDDSDEESNDERKIKIKKKKMINEDSNKVVDFPDWFTDFQLVFGELLLFPTSYININRFAKSWKWYDEPVNFHAQQDAAEFVQMLLNKLSEEIPIITELFQGEISHETVGTNVEFRSECKEKFVILPLEVNGNSNVEESFQTFLMPDIFEGNDQYEAEEIGKINAKRYHWLSKAPQILILQLKRFSFNVKTGRREKLNNEYTFPFELNLKTIMKSNNKIKNELEDPFFEEEEEENENNIDYKMSDDCFYDLIGVEMHTGDAGGGHYFCFCGPPCITKKQEKEWYKFDDKIAEKIDVNTIIDIAKGGNANNTQSAYLLYYQKRSAKTQELIYKEKQKEAKNEAESKFGNEEEETANNNNTTTNGIIKNNSTSANSFESTNSNSSFLHENKSKNDDNNENSTAMSRDDTFSSIFFNINDKNVNEDYNDDENSANDSRFESYHHKIDNTIIEKIANDVEELVKLSVIKNPDYSRFLMSIASTSNNLNFVYNFLLASLRNTKDKDEIIAIFAKLKEIMNPEISVRFLNEKTFIYNDFLVKSENRDIRKICSEAIISAVNHSDNQFEPYLQFIESYLPRSISNWTRFDDFALPLVYIIEKKSEYIDKKKWVTVLIDFFNKTLKNANNLQIFLLIKLDSIYRCLILLFNDPNLRNEFESTIYDPEFLRPLFISRRNSKNLACLIRDFIASPSVSKEENEVKKSKFFVMIIKFIYEENDMNVICGVFSTSLFLNSKSASSNNNNNNSSSNNLVSKNAKEKNSDDDELSSIDGELSSSFFDSDEGDDEVNTNTIITNIMSIIKSASAEENEQFLCDLILRIPYIQNKLILFLSDHTYFWTINWLLNVDIKIRNECCELLYKAFSEFPRLTFYDDNNEDDKNENDEELLYKKNRRMYAKQSLKQIAIAMYSLTKKFVEYSVSRLKNSYQLHCNGVDTFRMLPYRNFFELLRWAIVRTDSASIVLRKPKLLVNGMVKFKKIEKVNSDLCFATLRFIHSVIGIKHSKQFFKKRRFARKFVKVFSNATFDSINRYTSIETVSMIITLLPHLYSKYLFETRFFRNSLEYCFSAISVTAPQLENYIIANAKLKSFAPYFWSDTVFNRNYKDSNYYLSFTTNLLMMKQKLSNLFFDLGRPKQIMKNLVAISSSSGNLSTANATMKNFEENKKKNQNKNRKNTKTLTRSNSGHFSFLHHKNKETNKNNLEEAKKNENENENNIKLDELDQQEENNNFVEEFSSVSAKQIEVLVAFLRAYQQYGKKPRSLIKLMIGLRGEIERMLYISLINNGKNVRTDVLLAIYKVLMQLFVMGSEFEQIVLNYVRNGLLGNTREDVWSGAIELIRYICVILNANQKESTAYNLTLNELQSLKKPYNFRIIIELCDIITTPLFLYEPPVDGIVEFLNGIRVAGEMPNPMPKEIKKLILTLRDKEAKGISKLVELAVAQ